MKKYILFIEEKTEDDYKIQSNCRAKVYSSFKYAYRAFRKNIVEKITKGGTPYFPFIKEGKRVNTDFIFKDIDCKECPEEEFTEEDKYNADRSVDVMYKTVSDENYVFSDAFDLQYRDSEIDCYCDKNGIRFRAAGMDTYDVISNAHFPPNKDKQYYFFYEWCEDYDEWRTCSFAIRLLKQT